ncbi:MAG: helix-turn-helix transcriptional regulator [Deltaproteobacteria bacterium]|nr:helix-turn-helix transcriptional regulator [Deltaproteobacteria bacterium]
MNNIATAMESGFSVTGSAVNIQSLTQKFRTMVVQCARRNLFIAETDQTPLITGAVQRPAGSLTVEDFTRQMFPDMSDQELFDVFKADTAEEMASGRISRIKYHRLLAQMTQSDLAEKTGMRQANIARAESVNHTPNQNTLRKIAAALGVEVKELV